jgi:hypothetical protein
MVNHDIMSQYRVWCQYLQYRSRNISSVLVVSFLMSNPQHFVSCILSIVSCDVICSLCPWMRPTDFHNNLIIHETRMCLQKHRCDTTHDGGFATPSGNVRSWSHIFCGTSSHIDLFELTRTSVSGHHGRTGTALDVGTTLAGSSDDKSRPDDWDVCASSDRVRLCLPRKGDSSAFSQIVSQFWRKKTISKFSISIPVLRTSREYYELS